MILRRVRSSAMDLILLPGLIRNGVFGFRKLDVAVLKAQQLEHQYRDRQQQAAIMQG